MTLNKKSFSRKNNNKKQNVYSPCGRMRPSPPRPGPSHAFALPDCLADWQTAWTQRHIASATRVARAARGGVERGEVELICSGMSCPAPARSLPRPRPWAGRGCPWRGRFARLGRTAHTAAVLLGHCCPVSVDDAVVVLCGDTAASVSRGCS